MIIDGNIDLIFFLMYHRPNSKLRPGKIMVVAAKIMAQPASLGI
jgi:hypothetical protein